MVVKCAMSLSITSSVILILIDLNCCVLHTSFLLANCQSMLALLGVFTWLLLEVPDLFLRSVSACLKND